MINQKDDEALKIAKEAKEIAELTLKIHHLKVNQNQGDLREQMGKPGE